MMMRQLRRMLPSDEQLPQRLRWLRMRTCVGFLRLTLLCQRATISGSRAGCLPAIPAFESGVGCGYALLLGDVRRRDDVE